MALTYFNMYHDLGLIMYICRSETLINKLYCIVLFLNFMGLQPNIVDVMTSEMCFEHNHPREILRLI